MSTPFADMFEAQWPTHLASFGESITYTDASGVEHAASGVVMPRRDAEDLSDGWEQRARQAEIHIMASDLDTVTFTPRQDRILARGTEYSVLERNEGNGAASVYLCERLDIDAVRHRGRRF